MIPLNHKQLPTALVLTNTYQTTKFFQDTLEHTYHVIECQDIDMTMEILASTKLDIIFIDEQSFDVSSRELCQKIRKIPSYAKTPILVITNHLKRTYTKSLKQAGASGFILHPLDSNEIKQKISEYEKESQTKAKTSFLTQKISPLLSTDNGSLHKPINAEAITKQKGSVSLLMLEIDDFDALTKDFSEELNKELEEIILSRLKKCLRKQDSIREIKLGKFLIVLPKTSKTAASLIAENIKDSICSQEYNVKDQTITFTISIGLVSEDTVQMQNESPGASMNRLIDIAKKRLDQAKEVGNKIINK